MPLVEKMMEARRAMGRVLVVVVWLSLWEGLGSGGEGKGEDIESVGLRWAMDQKFAEEGKKEKTSFIYKLRTYQNRDIACIMQSDAREWSNDFSRDSFARYSFRCPTDSWIPRRGCMHQGVKANFLSFLGAMSPLAVRREDSVNRLR